MAATGTEARFFAPLYWLAHHLVWWFLRGFYRIRIRGTENIPWRGPVVLAALAENVMLENVPKRCLVKQSEHTYVVERSAVMDICRSDDTLNKIM